MNRINYFHLHHHHYLIPWALACHYLLHLTTGLLPLLYPYNQIIKSLIVINKGVGVKMEPDNNLNQQPICSKET